MTPRTIQNWSTKRVTVNSRTRPWSFSPGIRKLQVRSCYHHIHNCHCLWASRKLDLIPEHCCRKTSCYRAGRNSQKGAKKNKNQKANPPNPHYNNQIINSAYYVASTLLLLSLFYEWENRSTERAAPHFRLPNLAGVNLISGACSTYKHCKGGKCSC